MLGSERKYIRAASPSLNSQIAFAGQSRLSGEADEITPAVTLDHMRERTCVRQGGKTPLFGAKELICSRP